MGKKSIIFVSNGYGEDTIASSIIKEIQMQDREVVIRALPLVGEGKVYEKLGLEVIGPRRLMPSGGMIPEHIGNLIRDITSGLGRLTFEQVKALRRMRGEVNMTVAVGDIYPVILCSFFSSRPLVMVGTAKSDYFYRYNGFEKFFMSSWCEMVFPRDTITAESLKKCGIAARWVGNAMMDSLEFTSEDFSLPGEWPCVGILPGSRDFAYRDIVVIMGAIEELWKLLHEKAFFLMALAGSTEVEQLAQSTAGSGWTYEKASGPGSFSEFRKDGIRVVVVKNKFGDVLSRSHIIVGQAGTGNEQAVGMGKPVVTFESSGKEKMAWYRRRQKGLLGDSISVVQRDKLRIAEEVYAIMNDRERYESMRKIGYERMGPKGAASKIATYIMERLAEVKKPQ